MRPPAAIASAALLAIACAHPAAFGPALPEQSVPGHPGVATGEAAGARITARAGGWNGWPENLQDRLTPVQVTIENRSGRALRIRPEEFGLVAPNGFRYAAMSPAEVRHAVAELAHDYYGAAWSAGFYWGPAWTWGWYGPPWPWYGPWFGIDVYPYAYGPWPRYPPSSDLPQPGPQGTLHDGGQVTAQLFFPVPAQNLPQLELVANLVDDATGERFGTIRIPFLRQGSR
jgi:hypothetical protein